MWHNNVLAHATIVIIFEVGFIVRKQLWIRYEDNIPTHPLQLDSLTESGNKDCTLSLIWFEIY